MSVSSCTARDRPHAGEHLQRAHGWLGSIAHVNFCTISLGRSLGRTHSSTSCDLEPVLAQTATYAKCIAEELVKKRPSTLLTMMSPAMPRRPAMPCPGSEQSSPTSTISTLYPSAFAFSAAKPNCSLSPAAVTYSVEQV